MLYICTCVCELYIHIKYAIKYMLSYVIIYRNGVVYIVYVYQILLCLITPIDLKSLLCVWYLY